MGQQQHIWTKQQVIQGYFATPIDARRHVETFARPSHGENRGSSPLGSASKINYLVKMRRLVSNKCPINIYGQAWTSMNRKSAHARCAARMSSTGEMVSLSRTPLPTASTGCRRFCAGQAVCEPTSSPAPKFQSSTPSALFLVGTKAS